MAIAPQRTAIGIRRHFTTDGVHPYDEVRWARRDARIVNFRDGSVAFEQLGVEVPETWSVNATNILAQKYFRGTLGTPEREWSLKQVADRVVDTITAWGIKDGYFVDDAEAEIFRDELKHLIVHQKAAFNSPVWFNIGVNGVPQQGSACQPYDSLVTTPEGLIPIGRLVEENAIGIKVLDAHGVTRIVAVKHNGRKEVLRIHTKAGHKLDVTADHLVWRASDERYGRFVPAAELEPGDKLTWHRVESSGTGEITRHEIAEAALAGWLQSDGFVGRYEGSNRSLTIEAMTVTAAERRWVLDALDVVFPDVHRHERKVETQDTSLDCRRIRLYGNSLGEFVDAWGLRTRGSAMTVPQRLMTAPLPIVAAYLRSVFQAEGYVSLKGRSALIGLDMISEGVVRGMQALLARFGIFSRVRFKADRRPDRAGCWSLSVRPLGDRVAFADEIGFVDPVKAEKLERSFELSGIGAGAVKRLEIERVEAIGEMDVYDIQTESGEYLSANLRVHNCFILSVEDSMDSILNWYTEEGIIFKGGSGAGVNLSRIRSSHELLKGGGTASGPVSFMRGADASAGTIKSGGKTRRAAKMVILDADHPDIEDFVWCKAIEERKARVLRDSGFDMDLDGADSHSIQYQNANNSIRVTDEFMQAVEEGAEWDLKARTDGEVIRTVPARDLFRQVAHAAWECADPGMQFDTTINRWHTAPNTGRINGSNPCCFVGDTKVLTSEGLTTIAELQRRNDAGTELPHVMARNPETGVVELREVVKAWIAGYTSELIEVTTKQGGKFRCTPDHRFLTVHDGYVEARHLRGGCALESVGADDEVVCVEPVSFLDEQAVYDIEVAVVHNFAVAVANGQGVVVSNSEYMHLDNSACNLASLNLMKYLGDDGSFDTEGFKAAVEVVFTGQEIIVGNADYPTEKIAENSRRFRELGIGYANLGALLMANGLPYDSDGGRAWAAAITALMTGHAYATSARTAARMGPFAGFHDNAEPMVSVLRMHQAEAAKIDEELVPPELLSAAQESWDEAVELAEQYGVRNSQASVLAPTGCLVGGSLVSTGRGLVRLRSLGDPDGHKWQELDVQVATDEGPQDATKFYVNGLEPVVTVETARGHRVQGTPTHRVKVVDGTTGEWVWRRFGEIRTGDMVPLALASMVGEPQEVLLPPLADAYWTGEHHARVPRRMTADLAELVGYFMGDGSLHSRGLRLCVTSGDFDVVERLRMLAKECFGVEAKVAPKRGYDEVGVDSVRIALWWEACGFAKRIPTEGHSGKGYVAHIPDAVLHTNDVETYAAFLRGLYEADGDTSAGYPTLENTSIEMVRDVQTLLLAMGFPTSLSMRERDGSNSWGTAPLAAIRLLNASYSERWLDQVGFIGDRKNASVRVPGLAAAQAGRKDYIPVTRSMVDRLVPENDRLRRVLLMEVARGRASRRLASELFDRTGDPELGHLLAFCYDVVTSSSLGDEELTYDLSVPANVTYVANGFVSHNTIGLLMDCDTTGVEPDLGLVKTKKLVGGGTMSIVNRTVPRALSQLGYGPEQVEDVVAYIDEHKTIVGAPHIAPEHLAVFACSMGDNTIHYSGHVRMMGAVQPFISGAISKCVTGDTLIATEDGLVRIGRLYEGEEPDSFRPEHVLVASLDGSQKTDAFYYGGSRPVRRFELRSGHAITGTPNHRVMVADASGLSWRRLDELTVGDEVATRYGAEMWASVPARIVFVDDEPYGGRSTVRVPTEMTEELAFFLGAYASEGSTVRSTGSVRITSSVDEVLERVAEVARRVFGVRAVIRRPADGCPFVEIDSETVAKLLVHLGCGSRASEKRIPDAVLRSPRSHVLAFLQGLALDAYVTTSTMAKWAIGLDSPKLLDDLQAVLTNLGVLHSRIGRHDPALGKWCDEVYAAGRHAQTLAGMVPFLEPGKRDSAARLLERTIGDGATDIVPGVSGTDLYALLPERHRPRFRYLVDPRTNHVSRRTLERIATIDGVHLPDWMGTVLREGLHFSPVVQVADAGVREVYDLSVPTTHAFVGNGVVNHNTVNMPEDVTVEDVEQLHVDAWKLGIKAIAIYRDNCKVAQPLSTTKKEGTRVEGGDDAPPGSEAEAKDRQVAQRIAELEEALEHERQRKTESVVVGAVRERLPRQRRSKTFAFRVADCEGYVTVGEYEDGRPGEVFIKVSKQGSTLAGIMDAFSISISLGLQHGVPLATYVRKYSNMKFEPAGITDDAELRIASSLVDYIFRRVALDYLSYEDRLELGVLSTSERTQPTLPGVEESATPSVGLAEQGTMAGTGATAAPPLAAAGGAPEPLARAEQRDAPFCYSCGNVMQRSGSCYVCPSCGSTSGCS